MSEDERAAGLVFNTRDPVYLQVVRFFKEQIATGRLNAGDTIASRRELAGMLKINPNTAQKAYKEMEDQHLIITSGNSPSRVTSDAAVLGAVRAELIRDAVQSFVETIGKIDVPVDELLALVQTKYEAERVKTRREVQS